jgi:hypothetical protein
MKISEQERNTAKELIPVTKIDWMKTLLSLEDGVVYKFTCKGLESQRIVSSASLLRINNVADFVINSGGRRGIYMCAR